MTHSGGSARVIELRIRMSQMPDETRDFTHPPISWWRHEPKRTATGYRWLDWLTKPYWQLWCWWQTRLFWKTMDEKFLLSEAERELFRLGRSELSQMPDETQNQ